MTNVNPSLPENVPRSLADIRNARETRRDEQIRNLTEENKDLLEAMDKGEEEISAIQLELSHVNDEVRQLRESNFSVQSRAKVQGAECERQRDESEEREEQLKTVTAQHAQVLKSLEDEEEKSARLASDVDSYQIELRDLKVKHTCLTNDSNSTKEDATKSAKTCQLLSEENRLLRTEVESVKNRRNEENRKYSVEIETLEEQQRVRIEKQYQILEKLQSQEEARRQAEDQLSSMEENFRSLHSKLSSTETQLRLEISSKLSQADLIKKLSGNEEILLEKNKDINTIKQRMEQDQVRMEAEKRENGEQLREMATKVFQLIERQKIADLGKTRAMEALRTKEDEAHGLKKENEHLVQAHETESKLRAKTQTEKTVLEDQMRDLKKQKIQLVQRCKEETRLKVLMDDDKREAEAKVRTLNSRIALLLNKLQTDAEALGARDQDMGKLQSQVEASNDNNHTLQHDLDNAASIIKSLEENLREKESALDSARIKLDALQQLYSEQDEMEEESSKREQMKAGGDNPLLAGGRLRFFVDSKPSLGLFVLKGKCAKDRDWLEANQCNVFMRKASKSQKKIDLLLHKISELYGINMTHEEEIEKSSSDAEEQAAEVDKLTRKLSLMHKRLDAVEESNRRTLIKYINAVKASVSLGEPGCEKNREEVGGIGAGKIYLPEVSHTCDYTAYLKLIQYAHSSLFVAFFHRHVWATTRSTLYLQCYVQTKPLSN